MRGARLNNQEIKGLFMTRYVSGFQIVPDDGKKVEADLPSGHATVVRKIETLTGDVVVKEINKKNGMFSADIKEEDRQQWWLEAQKKAELIADEVRKKQNHAYFVPKTFVAHGKVREQYASGQRWRDVFKTLSPQDKEWACKALAQFVNDMSELRPIKHDNRVRSVPGVPIKGPGALADILDSWDAKYVAPEDKKLIQDVYEYLSRTPENQLMVFGHNDLHGDNIIIDIDKRQISIIDFELAGYQSAFDGLYVHSIVQIPEYWEYLNGLPRATNPGLQWNFVPEHAEMYRFLRWGYMTIVREGKSLESMSENIKEACKKIRYVLATARTKLKQPVQKQKQLLVAMSHYEKED